MTEPHFNGHTVHRDVTRYEPTAHFMERLKYRTDPAPNKQIARECIESGVVKNTHDPDRVIFEHDTGLHVWRVLARIEPGAFERETAKHDLLTIYAAGVHDDDHREVFDEVGP